jgi:tetratricopeptide (TPR) repeat protein/O-antigen ligase
VGQSLIGQALVGLPILGLPWIYGGVQSSVQVWLLGFVAVAWICTLVTFRNADETVLLPAAMIPLLLAIGLAAFQMAPLPPGVLKSLAPANAARWQRQLGEATSTEGGTRSTNEKTSPRTISLYAASTRRDLVQLVGAVAIFLAGAQFFFRPESSLFMLGAAALNGAAISFSGLIFQLRPATDVHLADAASPFATFINRNHAAGFLNLALAAAIGLAIWSFTHRQEASRGEQMKRQPNGRAGRAITGEFALVGRSMLARFSGWQMLSLLFIAIVSAGIVCSMSRGAWVAASCAALCTAIALGNGWGARRRSWILVVAAAMGVILVCWIGKGELIQGRLGTLWTQIESPDGRLAHWRDGLSAAGEFLPLGSGLGTYRYVYLLHETTSNDIWFYHAENQYLEALVEGGWPGLLLVLALIGLTGWACRRLLREPVGSVSFACGAAGVFGLVSQVVHSFFDFGLYVPSNMALFALMIGSVCGLAAHLEAHGQVQNRGDRSGEAGVRRLTSSIASWASMALVLPASKSSAAIGASLVTVAAGLACLETSRAAVAEAALRDAKEPILARQPASESKMTEAIAGLEKAVAARPDDAEVQLGLAKLRMVSYRKKLLAHWQQGAPGTDTGALWQRTAPGALHGWLSTLQREGHHFELESLRRSAAAQADLATAARHLALARKSCPIIAETHLLLAEVAPFVSLEDDEEHLERMRNVTRDGRLLIESGLVELQAGRIEQAVRDWKRAIAQSPEQLPQILEYAVQREDLATRMEPLLPEDPVYLVELAKSRFVTAEQQPLRKLLLKQASNFLAKCDEPAARHYVEGTILSLQDETEGAVAKFERAVQLRPEQTGWRYELALGLQKLGNVAAAHEQAGVCVLQDPNDPRYEQLLRQLVRLQLTTHGTPPR